MTEDDAKTKACPYAKNFGASQQVAEGPGPNCLGSACMAWREKKVWRAPEVRTSHNPAEDAVLEIIGGFCGLAGEPK